MLALVAGGVLGFLAGLTTFRRSLRWCRECGETLRCPLCTGGARAPAPHASEYDWRDWLLAAGLVLCAVQLIGLFAWRVLDALS